jgi:hypothetical protein
MSNERRPHNYKPRDHPTSSYTTSGDLTRGYLEVDRTVPRIWRFWPAEVARHQFAGEAARRRAEALKDPDARLGVIDAIVEAFENDPATPLLMLRKDEVDIVRHPHWRSSPMSCACTISASSRISS